MGSTSPVLKENLPSFGINEYQTDRNKMGEHPAPNELTVNNDKEEGNKDETVSSSNSKLQDEDNILLQEKNIENTSGGRRRQ